MKNCLWLLLIIPISMLAACATLFPGLDPSTPIPFSLNPTIEVVTPISAETPNPIIAIAATPAPAQALINLPTVTANMPIDSVPTDQAGLEAWLAAAWQADLPIPEVESRLDQAGWLMPSSLLSNGLVHRGVLSADITGDNSDEWLLSLIVPESSSHEALIPQPRAWPGNFYIVNGDGIVYRHYIDPTISAEFTAAPWPISISDINNDGLPDILLDELGHNGQRYFGRYYFLTGASGKIEDRSSAELNQVREQPQANILSETNPMTLQLRVWRTSAPGDTSGFYQLEQYLWQDTQLARVNTSIDRPSNIANLSSYLSNQWAERIDSARIRAELLNWAWIHSEQQWLTADFDGDLRDDWGIVAKTDDPATPDESYNGDILIVSGNGVYRLSQDLPSYHSQPLQHQISLTGDMTGDQLPELLIEQRYCNESGNDCTSLWRAISAQRGTLANLTRSSESEQNQAALARLPEGVSSADSIIMANSQATIGDRTGDGLADLIINGDNSAENDNRPNTQTWAWSTNEARFILTQTTPDASPYRIHLLIDATNAQSPERAIELYQQVINNDSLLDDNIDPDDLRRFAAFRLADIAINAQNLEESARLVSLLEANYSGAPITLAARAMQDAALVGSTPTAACETARSILAGYENPLGALRAMGPENPALTINGLCATE